MLGKFRQFVKDLPVCKVLFQLFRYCSKIIDMKVRWNLRPYNLYCVGADIKPCSINQSINQWRSDRRMEWCSVTIVPVQPRPVLGRRCKVWLTQIHMCKWGCMQVIAVMALIK